MGAVSGSYASITRGVSEQVPHERKPGQHTEQINMLSDPVRGTARRHGSYKLDEKRFATGITGANIAAAFSVAQADAKLHKARTAYFDGVEYSVLLRTAAAPVGTTLPGVWCINKDTGTILPTVRPVTDTTLDAMLSGGASAFCNVGDYVFIAGNTIVPALTETDNHGAQANQKLVAVWVRGGAYSRTFTVKLSYTTSGGTTVKTFSYKTKASSYPGVLDTSGILYSDPEYQKKINDANADYNTAATQWIGEAAEDIQPDNIAEQLKVAAAAVSVTATRIGSTLTFDLGSGIISADVSVDDGGDGTLLRGVGSEVSAADLVTTTHYVGKVVKIRPESVDGSDAYYLKAEPKIPGQTGWTEVIWRESAGVTQTPTTALIYGTVSGGTFYIASSATKLTSILAGTHPEIQPSVVGDEVSSPAPSFFGKKISYLGLFQDRLVVGTGATLFFSRNGDYLNWFRQSTLTVADDDPVEAFALGSEDDTITHSATYDKNLFLFGKRKQYAVSGRTVLTPKANSIIPMTAFEDATDAAPVQSGNLLFYSKPRQVRSTVQSSSVYQLQIGVVADSPESYDVSQQLDKYIKGTPLELVAITAKPHSLFLRTTDLTNGMYVYRYIDTQGGNERLWDSWSRWEWDATLGVVAGISEHNGAVLAMTVRKAPENGAATHGLWLCLDKFTLDSGLSDYPYVDSMRTYSEYAAAGATAWMHDEHTTATAAAAVSFDSTVNEFLLGTTGDKLQTLVDAYPAKTGAMWVGVQYPASFTPTNPYIKDRNEKAVLDGRLTFSRIALSIVDSGGLTVTVERRGVAKEALQFNGRRTGYSTSALGRQPIVTDRLSAAVGSEVRECAVTVAANSWLPLTVSAIGWRGQFFNHTRRV